MVHRLAFPQATPGFYQGHCPGSPFWWGDLCSKQIEYVRNLTFSEINLLRVNPSIPYRDPGRPHVRWWFSATDAEDAEEFNHLLRPENQRRLEAEGGVCIIATHFGKGFGCGGKINPETRRLLELLAARNGWFAPVGNLLDWLRAQRRTDGLPAAAREIGFCPPDWKRYASPLMKAARIFDYQQPPRIVEVPEPAVAGPFDVVVRVAGAGPGPSRGSAVMPGGRSTTRWPRRSAPAPT